mmetsp:Transcript_1101/g.2406  ORF Transcript_1101/g.2406 Transcript_1101/m.2406 type:complete len:346 (+) Transcript_1101:96-1133(+)|eukprot:CAMPEP_0194341340 /NCGR_PEP_ID=MMETSP0171-20130528/89413_1 /TAXON_ID=218684 /ORGANISM="Corethron pennatum, Strain L29A3" /LENGTH=345 /DNA_ID=CAMNT_0039106653 /DNA_START=16 /DNA_END=1053 /DNA_ORIENTATION=+
MNGLESNEIFMSTLEEKVLKLADNIKTLQGVVKDAESRAKQSEETVAELKNELATVEKKKEAVVTSVISLQAKFDSEKISSEAKIKAKIDEIQGLKKCSKEEIEAAKLAGEKSVAALELKITGLKKQLHASQNECTKSKILSEELRKKVIDFEDRLKKETNARINAETVSASMIAKLEKDMAKEIADLSISKEKELQESALNFKKLENLFHEQTKVLGAKEDVIETYERERGSLPKIAKLGFAVAGERGRSLARGASTKGQSFVNVARSRSRGFRSRPRPKRRQQEEAIGTQKVEVSEKREENESQNVMDLKETLEDLEIARKPTKKLATKKKVPSFLRKRSTQS